MLSPPLLSLTKLCQVLAQKYRVLIYSGDSDGCVPHVGTEEWTTALGFPVAEEWRPWVYSENTSLSAIAAGYVVQFGDDSKDFRFATVLGAGHEVPMFKPAAAYAMFKRFQQGKRL